MPVHVPSSRLPVLLPALLLACLSGPVSAQGEYPSRPIRFVVPFPPGGATDFVTRLYAEQMQQSLGRPFAVENRGGAGGNVGATEVARAAPDGYTILMGSPGPNAINQFLYAKMPFPPDAFAPVVLAGKEMRDRMASVGAELGGGTVAEFAAFVADEVRKWKTVAEVSGAKVD